MILVPLDGSPEAESILPALLPLALTGPVVVTLLQVAATEEEMGASRVYLGKKRMNLSRGGIRPVTRVEWGHPAEKILELIEGRKYDLIAMTTHGRTGLRRVLAGSVAEEVLRHTCVPAIMNRPDSRIGDWRRIVVALDGSPAAETILPDAVRLARTLKATLQIVRTAVAVGDLDGIPYLILPEDPLPYLQRICDRLARQGAFALPVALDGHAADEIVRYAGGIGAGLICMTTHGRTGFSRALVGSVAEEVIRAAPCPVLVRRTAGVEAPVETRLVLP